MARAMLSRTPSNRKRTKRRRRERKMQRNTGIEWRQGRKKERKEGGKSTVYLGDADDGLVNGWMKGGREGGFAEWAGRQARTDCLLWGPQCVWQ